MQDSPRLQELFARWSEGRARGTPPTPADLCRDCPELAARLEAMIRAASEHTLATPPPDATRGVPSAPAAPAQPPPDGRLGHYRLVRLLGEGGMGSVWLAHDDVLGRQVALKVMRPEVAAKPENRTRFLREARAAAALQHDHILTVYQVGEAGGVPYIAMPVLSGEPLERRLARDGRLHPRDAVRLGRETAEALAAASERGLVHRDIKPDNLWLEAPHGRVKVLDFGLARLNRDDGVISQSGAILGTPAYMAPEQAAGRAVDGRADVFSLGVVLYRCLTGVSPFRRDGVMATLMALAVEQPPPPHLVDPAIPEHLSRVVMWLMEKDPARRPAPADAARHLAALEHAAHVPAPTPVVAAAPRGRSSDDADIWSGMADEEPGAIVAPQSLRLKRPPSLAEADEETFGVPWKPIVAVTGAVVLACLALIAWLVWPAGPARGRLAFESDDPKASVRLLRDGKEVAALTAGEVSLPAGEYDAELAPARPGRRLSDDRVTVAAGARAVLRLLTDAPVVVGPTPPGETAEALRRSDLPAWLPAVAGRGNPRQAPPELLAVFGDPRFRVAGLTAWPAYSPDGKWLAAASGNDIALFDARTGARARTIPGHTARPYAFAWSPDGSLLASAGFDQSARVWEAGTGREVARMIGHVDVVYAVAFSPDGTLLATGGGDTTARLWEPTTGKQVRRLDGHVRPVRNVTFSPDGTLLATSAEGPQCRLWQAATGKLVAALADGADASTGRVARFNADGTLLAVGCETHLSLWGLQGGRRFRLWTRDTPSVFLAFSPDGQEVWSAGHGLLDRPFTFTRHGLDGEPAGSWTTPSAGGSWVCSALSPDGKTLAVCEDGGRTVRPFDPLSGKAREGFSADPPGHNGGCIGVAWSPDGRLLATAGADKTVRVFEAATGRQRHKLEGHTAGVWCVSFSADSRAIASTGTDGTVRFWDASTGAERPAAFGTTPGIHRGGFSADGKAYAGGTGDGFAVLFEPRGGRESWRSPKVSEAAVRAAAVSPDGRLVAAGGTDGAVCVVERPGGAVTHRFANDSIVNCVRFSPDGKSLAATLDEPDGLARVYRLTTGEVVTLAGHGGHVQTADWSPDGRLLATCATDRTVRVWDLKAGRHAVLGPFEGSVHGAAFAPDGRHLAAAMDDGTAAVFRLPGPAAQPAWVEETGPPPAGLPEAEWLKAVARRTPGNRAQAVAERLAARNRDSVPSATFDADADGVRWLRVVTENVTDLSPLAALPELRGVSAVGAHDGKRWRVGGLTDVTPLAGLRRLERVELQYNRGLADLRPLKGLPVRHLDIGFLAVDDLSPLEGMPLEWVSMVGSAGIADLSPLKGSSVRDLGISHLPRLTDLSPLAGSRLRNLWLDGSGVKDLTPLKNVPLQAISLGTPGDFDLTPLRSVPLLRVDNKPAAEFWRENPKRD